MPRAGERYIMMSKLNKFERVQGAVGSLYAEQGPWLGMGLMYGKVTNGIIGNGHMETLSPCRQTE